MSCGDNNDALNRPRPSNAQAPEGLVTADWIEWWFRQDSRRSNGVTTNGNRIVNPFQLVVLLRAHYDERRSEADRALRSGSGQPHETLSLIEPIVAWAKACAIDVSAADWNDLRAQLYERRGSSAARLLEVDPRVVELASAATALLEDSSMYRACVREPRDDVSQAIRLRNAIDALPCLAAALNKGEAEPGTINVPMTEWDAQSAVIETAQTFADETASGWGTTAKRLRIELVTALARLDALPDPSAPCARVNESNIDARVPNFEENIPGPPPPWKCTMCNGAEHPGGLSHTQALAREAKTSGPSRPDDVQRKEETSMRATGEKPDPVEVQRREPEKGRAGERSDDDTGGPLSKRAPAAGLGREPKATDVAAAAMGAGLSSCAGQIDNRAKALVRVLEGLEPKWRETIAATELGNVYNAAIDACIAAVLAVDDEWRAQCKRSGHTIAFAGTVVERIRALSGQFTCSTTKEKKT